MSKKSVLILLLTIIIFCAICLGLSPSYVSHPESFTVVIDAGHGGVDGGASGVNTKVKESDINLAVALKLKEYFENAGISVVLTRSTPMGLYGVFSKGFKRRDCEKRVEIAKKANADIFVSIHMNKFSQSSRSGAQVFHKDDAGSINLAKCIQQQLDKIDTDKRQGICQSGDYYVLNNSPMPSVICECGFLSNPQDESLLITDEYQSKLAYSIFLGATSYFYNSTNSDYTSIIEK